MENEIITATVEFVHSDGDIDIILFDPSGTRIAFSDSTEDGEAITAEATQAGAYALQVYGFDGAENSYSVEMSNLPQEISSDGIETPQ